MELLLNLVWIALSVTAFVCFLRAQEQRGRRIPYCRSLFALACILFFLFPIISASDDLHPAQAVVEDTTRRIQQLASPLQVPAGHSILPPFPPMLLGTWLVLSLTLWHWRKPEIARLVAAQGFAGNCDGRSPPLFD